MSHQTVPVPLNASRAVIQNNNTNILLVREAKLLAEKSSLLAEKNRLLAEKSSLLDKKRSLLDILSYQITLPNTQ